MTSAWNRPWCASLDAGAIGKKVELVGWVRRRRDLGGLVFVDLRDRSGLVQLVFEDQMVAEGEKLSGEDVIRVVGEVRPRAEGQTNTELASGEIELKVIELGLLTESETPPFVVEDEANASEELRLKYRYLDLRSKGMQERIILRSKVFKPFRHKHPTVNDWRSGFKFADPNEQNGAFRDSGSEAFFAAANLSSH